MMHGLTGVDVFALQTALVAGLVYLAIEILKLCIGRPARWIVMLANPVMSALGAAACHGTGWNLSCLGMTVLAAAAAAGIHGTVRSWRAWHEWPRYRRAEGMCKGPRDVYGGSAACSGKLNELNDPNSL